MTNLPHPERGESKAGRAEPTCANCLGSGWLLCLNSMFMGDGCRRERCGVCGGSGHSRYHAEPGAVKWQREARIRDAAIRAHLRSHPKADYLELGRVARAALTEEQKT